MKEAPQSPYPNLIFRETFNSEFETRRNGWKLIDVDFSKGVAKPTASSGYLTCPLNKSAFEFTVRIKFKIVDKGTGYRYIINSQTLDESTKSVHLRVDANDSFSTSNFTIPYANGESYPSLTATNGQVYDVFLWSNSSREIKDLIINKDSNTAGVIDGSFEYELCEIYNGHLTISEMENLYNNSWDKEQVFSGSEKSDIIQGIDFTDGWGISGPVVINDANTFTTTGAGGPAKTLVIVGKKYNCRIIGTTTSTSVNFQSTIGGHIYKSLHGTFDEIFTFTAQTTEGLWLRAQSAGVTVITSMTLQEVNPKTLIDFDSTNGVLEDRTVGNTVGEQKLSNNDFTDGQTSWNFWYGNNTATFTGDQMFMPGGNNRYYQANVTEVGKKYRAIIRYKSDLPWGAGNSSPTGNIDASNDWTTATIEFVMESQPHFYLTALTADSNVYIDYINLYEIRDDLSATDVVVNKNGALFNGTTSKIDTGTDMIGTKAITVMGWIKPYSLGESSNPSILENGKMGFVIYNITRLRLTSDSFATNTYSAIDTISLNKWQFIVVTRKANGKTSFYIGDKNTAPVLSGSADQDSGTPVSGTTDVIIGNNDTQARTFDGLINKLTVVEGILDIDSITQYWSETLKELN